MVTTVLAIGLAALGVAIAAVALLAPRPAALPGISFAPPAAALDDWNVAPPDAWLDALPDAWIAAPPSRTFAGAAEAPADVDESSPARESASPCSPEVRWTMQLDARAGACDAETRLALARALASIRTPWADALLREALREEPDRTVRAVIGGALDRRD